MTDFAQLADALWRAVTYVSVAQLHLESNPLLTEPLVPEQVKNRPSGHWGTVPGVAFVLSHVMLAGASIDDELVPIIGAGHAGVAQVAMAWLTGDLARVRPRFGADAKGLSRLVAAFPDLDGLGAEVSPSLPGGWYLGGQIGGALAFAQGAALDAPDRILVPVLGDGECETPATAAAWLTGRALADRTRVLPIIQVNGFRMGSQSLLGAMDDDALRGYATGLGWRSSVVHLNAAGLGEHQSFRAALVAAVTAVREQLPTAIFLRCTKGWSGPAELAARPLLGTPLTHKTPLTDPRRHPDQLATLRQWLASYRPAELFTANGTATGALAEAVRVVQGRVRPRRTARHSSAGEPPTPVRYGCFASAVTAVLRKHAGDGDFHLFSPDELASNRLGDLAQEPWATEVLAEEVLLSWLAGWTATGRRGLLVSYEAFAPLLLTGLVQLLKQYRVMAASEKRPSLNLLLTSYGWHNTYTHGDPSLTTALLATQDPAVRVLTPADPSRLAVVLDRALNSVGQVNVILAGKHPTDEQPLETVEQECARGLAVWPHTSDDGEPDLVILAAGDLPATIARPAALALRQRRGLRVRVVGVQDLTTLGDPAIWPSGLSAAEIRHYFGATAPLVIATLGHRAAVWGLIEGRLRRPVTVIGWCEPAGPMSQHRLAETAGMDVAGLSAAAERLLTARWAGEGRRALSADGNTSKARTTTPVPAEPVDGIPA
ncbi:phosphoketolase family protein [Plantactinospora sonchi]|uniref:Phosphoketolase n=1 Tax=Plantactinospora sonchi TaxID=1544735 RepID=A0ABU7RUI0_9ACTN